MTKQEEQVFKRLIKEGTLEVLTSHPGQEAIVNALGSSNGQEAIVNALGSSAGQEAIVNALGSSAGQEAIKSGALKAMKSEEGKQIFTQNFADAVHDTLGPTFENYSKRIKKLEDKLGVTV